MQLNAKKEGTSSTSTYKTFNANSTGKMFSLSLVCLKSRNSTTLSGNFVSTSVEGVAHCTAPKVTG